MLRTKCDAVLLLSGGIDSTTMLYKLTNDNKRVMCLIFDYGQSLIKEVEIAARNAERMQQPWKIIKIDLSFAESACALISDNEIPAGRTMEQIDSEIPASYVEFRNGIFLAYAVMYAECNGIDNIYGGFNGLNSGQYYDDTYAFIKAFEAAANAGTKPSFRVRINAPFADTPKSEIVKQGIRIGVNYDDTWSCYGNEDRPCGVCDSCLQRERALKDGGYYV